MFSPDMFRTASVWTPPSLAALPAPPQFAFRAAEPQEVIEFGYDLDRAGVRYHETDPFRAEMLRGLRELWSPATYATGEARLRAAWAAWDAGSAPDESEAEAIAELTQRLTDAWPPLARMAADNLRFPGESAKNAIARVVVGWTDTGVPYRREMGRVPLATLDELERAMGEMDKLASIGATSFGQLASEALARIRGDAPAAPTITSKASRPRTDRPAVAKSRRKKS